MGNLILRGQEQQTQWRAAEVPLNLTLGQVYANVDRETSLEQIIADLKEERGTEK